MTDFRVSTKVYFDGIYTGLISQTYDEVLVSEMTDANNVKHTYYADDMYGYDIIWSQSSYAASGCAVAFVDKYYFFDQHTGLYGRVTTDPESVL